MWEILPPASTSPFIGVGYEAVTPLLGDDNLGWQIFGFEIFDEPLNLDGIFSH